MVKTIGSSKELALKAFRADGNEIIEGDCVDRTNKMPNKLFKSRKSNYLQNYLKFSQRLKQIRYITYANVKNN